MAGDQLPVPIQKDAGIREQHKQVNARSSTCGALNNFAISHDCGVPKN